ncbi:MAG: hypothetical protein C3F08_02930 [Candidatus Methylomirabilota bacterium]|nr:MAG: hypothetical protein C3F08_02930 [candidate division NC10 bacterium]
MDVIDVHAYLHAKFEDDLSDAPVLGPDPTVRNEPQNIRLACERIAQIKGLSADIVAHATTENARRLFPRVVW